MPIVVPMTALNACWQLTFRSEEAETTHEDEALSLDSDSSADRHSDIRGLEPTHDERRVKRTA